MRTVAVIVVHVVFLSGLVLAIVMLLNRVRIYHRALMLWRDRAFRLRNRLNRLCENFSFEEERKANEHGRF